MIASYPLRFLRDNVRYGRNIPSFPFLLNYSVTFRCNLDCRYCGVSRLKENYADTEVNCREISSFLCDERLKKLDAIFITGGEPFLKNDLPDILMAFQEKVFPRVFHITTNGYLTDGIVDSVKFLKSKGLNMHIKVSIDDIADAHDALRGRRGSFENAVRTIERLRSIFDRKKLLIGINQTVFEENYRSIPRVKALAESLDASYRGIVGLKKRPLYSEDVLDDFGLVDLSDEAKETIKAEFKEIYFKRRSIASPLAMIDDMAIRYYVDKQLKLLDGSDLVRHKCMSLFTYFRLNPNGDVITCSYDLDVLGNIRGEAYSSIMEKDVTLEKLCKIKGCSKCWLGCEAMPSWVSSLFCG
ncbi:radical SAM/SPASM domain-containing protein [Candidatus Omnitrophota bacterium]